MMTTYMLERSGIKAQHKIKKASKDRAGKVHVEIYSFSFFNLINVMLAYFMVFTDPLWTFLHTIQDTSVHASFMCDHTQLSCNIKRMQLFALRS